MKSNDIMPLICLRCKKDIPLTLRTFEEISYTHYSYCEDCLREGVRKLESENCSTMFTFDGWSFKNKVNRCTDSPKEAFEALFKKLSGKKAWDDNPWVFVYEFELIK